MIYDNRFKKIYDVVTFVGGDCLQDFLNYLLVMEKKLELQMFDDLTQLISTPGKLRQWEEALFCSMCKFEFDESSIDKRKVKGHG